MAISGWNVRGGKCRGPGHVTTGTPCQDALNWDESADLIILAVADGAGSSSVSQTGSYLSVMSSVGYLKQPELALQLSDGDELLASVIAAMEVAAREVSSSSALHGRQTRDFASTLSLVVLTERVWVAATIGDSPVVVDTKSEGLSIVAKGTNYEFASETDFLTSPDWRLRVATGCGDSKDLLAAALMSDGTGFCAIDLSSGSPSPKFFKPLFDAVRAGTVTNSDVTGVLDSTGARARSGDDKALLLAVRNIE